MDKWVCYRINRTCNGCCVDCNICFYGELIYGECGNCCYGHDRFSYDCFLCDHYDPERYDYTASGAVFIPKQLEPF